MAPKKKVPRAFLETLATHRNRLEKVVQGGSAATLKGYYEDAEAALVSRVAKAVKAKRGDTFTAYQQRVALAQLREGQRIITQAMAGKMGPLSKKAQELAVKGVASDVARLSKHFTGAAVSLPVEEASVMAGVIQGRAPSLLRQHATSMARYGANLVGKLEKNMALSLLTGKSSSEAMDEVTNAIDGEWWQGERIVRTEMAYAFNATHRDSIEESAKEVPELWMRWEEHADEAGNPLDNRVAVDSLALHGQVAPPGSQFIMPATSPIADAKGKIMVPEALVGLAWDFPPNRPNDRAVLSPWMREWGVPGWLWQGGRRVWL